MGDIKHLSQFESNNSIQKIAELDRIYIKKSYIYVACNDGYSIFGIHRLINNDEYDPKAIFYVAEYSNKCGRQNCNGDCRQFKLLVSDTSEKEKNETFEKNVFIEFNRPQRCTFCCLKRPEMYVNVKIVAVSVQLCVEVVAAKKHAKRTTLSCMTKTKKNLFLQKQKQYDCGDSCMHSIYDKIAEFPQGASTQDKILLVAAIIMHDLTFLEMPPERRRVENNMN